MSDFTFHTKDLASPEEVEELLAGLEKHTMEVIGSPGFEPVAIHARDSEGNLVGGVTATINWKWLAVKLLWVREGVRGRGLGRDLMNAIEDLGRSRGCLRAHVDTLGFQAPAFYEQLGYEPFAELPDYAPGYPRIYYRKAL